MKVHLTIALGLILASAVLTIDAKNEKKSKTPLSPKDKKDSDKKDGDKKENSNIEEERRVLQAMLSKMPFVPMIPISFLLGNNQQSLLDNSQFKGTLVSKNHEKNAAKKSSHSSPQVKNSNEETRQKTYSDKGAITQVKSFTKEDPVIERSMAQRGSPRMLPLRQDDLDDDEEDDDDDDDDGDDDQLQQPQRPRPTGGPLTVINDQISKTRSNSYMFPTDDGGSNICKSPCPLTCAPACNSLCCASAIYKKYFGGVQSPPQANVMGDMGISQTEQQTIRPYVPVQAYTSQQQANGVARALATSYDSYQRSLRNQQLQAPSYGMASYAPPAPTVGAAILRQTVSQSPVVAPSMAAVAAPSDPISAAYARAPVAATVRNRLPYAQAPNPYAPLPAAVNSPVYPYADKRRFPSPPAASPYATYPGIVETYSGAQQKPTFCPSSCARQCTQYCQPQCCGVMKRDQIGGKEKLLHLKGLMKRLQTTLSSKKDVLENISTNILHPPVKGPVHQRSIPTSGAKQSNKPIAEKSPSTSKVTTSPVAKAPAVTSPKKPAADKGH